MIFKLHYWFTSAGASAIGLLMGVFLETYAGASTLDNGLVFMLMPFSNIIARPIICSLADRAQAHRKYLMVCQLIVALTFTPFIVIPYLGPEVYQAHQRACWYALVVPKIIGDMAFGGIMSVGDSLAINYAHRLGADFYLYRIWGTMSWMVFGMIIGHVNELSFVPKYVPGFVVLILSSLANMLCVFLWPPEYFRMVPMRRDEERDDEAEQRSGSSEKRPIAGEKAVAASKSLMSRQEVRAHAKAQLIWLLTMGHVTVGDASSSTTKIHQIELNSGPAEAKPRPSGTPELAKPIPRRAQMRALALLIRRDARIVLYIVVCLLGGMSLVAVFFFFLNLSEICHRANACEFSRLAGGLQMAMAIAETLVFMYIGRIQATIGRLNTCACAFLLASIKYLFYGLAYSHVSPYYALLAETVQGAIFGVFMTVMVELGHTFANEVEFVLPELVQSGVVADAAEAERMRMSLSATMQALMSTAQDGLGRGLGALLYGSVLEFISYQSLWLLIGISLAVICAILLVCSAVSRSFDIVLGLDERARRARSGEKEKHASAVA